MKRPFVNARSIALFAGLGLVALAIAGCGGDDGGPNPPPCEGAHCDPQVLMQALADSLENIPDDADRDDIRALDFSDIRDGFDAILAAEPNNRLAHLGSGILDVLELNYDADLWSFIDDVADYGDEWDWDWDWGNDWGGPVGPPGGLAAGGLHLPGRSPILRNQFTLLATAPRAFMQRAASPIPANLTIARLQDLLLNAAIPALSSAINHFEAAENGEDLPFQIALEDETNELDMGEIYFFHAATVAARAAFRIATAYDVSLPGPDGSYSWLDDIQGIERCGYESFFEVEGDSSTYVQRWHWSRGQTAADSLGLSILRYNLENRSGFLEETEGGMASAFADIQYVRDLVALAVESIREESDGQANDVIRIQDLTDIDDDIDSDSHRPTFAENFHTIEDVLEWVDTVLSGPYQVHEEGGNGMIDLTVDLKAFFDNAPSDWKALLPYHQWRNPSDWTYLSDPPGHTNDNPWSHSYSATDCDGNQEQRDDVAATRTEYWWYDLRDPIDFLDGPGGNAINLDDVGGFPYMEDYTFGGLFPGMNRDDWVTVFENAG